MSTTPSKQVKKAAKTLKSEQKQLETFKTKSQKLKTDAKKKIGDDVKAVKTLATKEQKLITKTASDTLKLVRTNRSSINKELADAQKHAQKTKDLIDNRLREINAKLAEITKYHNQLLDDKKGKSIKTSVDEYIKNQQEDYKKLRQGLETEIRDLFPEAGTSGLSSAYFEAKRRYGAVPYKKLTEDEEAAKTKWHFLKIWGHYIATNTKGIMFYTLFIAPLVAIITLMVYGKSWGLDEFIINNKLNFNALWNRFFISSPFAVISWFGWSSIRLNRRLYEEYNHKQRVMQLYRSFIKQITDETQKKRLVNIMLENVSDKPSIAVRSGKEKRSLFERVARKTLPAGNDE